MNEKEESDELFWLWEVPCGVLCVIFILLSLFMKEIIFFLEALFFGLFYIILNVCGVRRRER